jgi:hypothetical protein
MPVITMRVTAGTAHGLAHCTATTLTAWLWLPAIWFSCTSPRLPWKAVRKYRFGCGCCRRPLPGHYPQYWPAGCRQQRMAARWPAAGRHGQAQGIQGLVFITGSLVDGHQPWLPEKAAPVILAVASVVTAVLVPKAGGTRRHWHGWPWWTRPGPADCPADWHCLRPDSPPVSLG